MRITAAFCCVTLLSQTLVSAGSFRRAIDTDQFQMYGYGPGIGGLTLFYSDGNAFVGDYDRVDSSTAAPVIFQESNGSFLGSPNTTVFPDPSDAPTWSNNTFAIPAASSSSHTVGFSQSNKVNSSIVTDSFTTYGASIFVTGDKGQMVSLWYAVPSNTRGVYALRWNSTGDNDRNKVPLTMRKTPPSNAS